MRAFACPRCGHMVYFENDRCLRCGAGLGFDPRSHEMVLMADGVEAPLDPGVADSIGSDARPEPVSAGYRCANQLLAGCNWVLADRDPAGLCLSCRITRTRPNDADLGGDPHVAQRFTETEAAKRRLVFQLLELNLPLDTYHDTEGGLAFDFLIRKDEPVLIGHEDGVITIDLAESDDAYRERMRAQLSEAYRTMLGHLRHEVGHYYWDALVEPHTAVLDAFRALFGDDRVDYTESLERHYGGPQKAWDQHYVSAYASAHPWEDWAETWAHYLHIRDTLQTAASYGVIVTGPRFQPASPAPPGRATAAAEASLMAAPSIDSGASLDEILADWLPLTYALNAINRSMGDNDLYPFVLSPNVIEKLRFVHQRVLRSAGEADDGG